MRIKKTKEEIIERLMKWVSHEPNTSCWLWMGFCNHDGYGKTSIGSWSGSAHIAFYRLFKGEIPKGLEIDHLCRVRCCVNPDHLEAVTHSVNIKRGDIKSNHYLGRKTHCIRGHEFSEENTERRMTKGYMSRRCKACAKFHHESRPPQRKENPLPSHNSTITHCPYGHEYTEANTTRKMKKGYMSRDCKLCDHRRQVEKRIAKGKGVRPETLLKLGIVLS